MEILAIVVLIIIFLALYGLLRQSTREILSKSCDYPECFGGIIPTDPLGLGGTPCPKCHGGQTKK